MTDAEKEIVLRAVAEVAPDAYEVELRDGSVRLWCSVQSVPVCTINVRAFREYGDLVDLMRFSRTVASCYLASRMNYYRSQSGYRTEIAQNN